MTPRKTESFRASSPADAVPATEAVAPSRMRDGETVKKDVLGPLTAKQRSFIRDCVETQRPLADVMDDHNITPERFAKWMNLLAFRHHLEKTCRMLAKAREFDIAVGARRAAELMRRNNNPDGDPPLKPEQVKAAVELIRFARSSEARRKAERADKPVVPGRMLIHPDITPAQGRRLLRQMDRAANR